MHNFLLYALLLLFSCLETEKEDDVERLTELQKLFFSNQPEKINTQLQDYLKTYPKSATAHRMMGWTCLELEKKDCAKTYFNKAIALNPKADNAYVGLGVLARKENDLDGARKNYKKAIEILPNKSRSLWKPAGHRIAFWRLSRGGQARGKGHEIRV